MKTGWQLFVLERQHGFYETTHTGCRIEMAQVALEGTERAISFLLGDRAECLVKSGYLNRITKLGSSAMSLYVGDSVRSDAGVYLGSLDHFRLTINARCGKADLE